MRKACRILLLAAVLSAGVSCKSPVKEAEMLARENGFDKELSSILSAEGLTAAEIAARTFLSVHTVNTHRQHIYAKMDVKNVADMLRKAGELGIL